jgi:hypothetical protein
MMDSGSGNRRGSSFSQSRRHKFPFNAASTNQSKVSTFSQRVIPPPSTGTNTNASTSHFKDHDDIHDAQGSSNFEVLLGTCSYMCPGKYIFHY